MKEFLVRRWFLLSLAAVLAAGFLASDVFLPLTEVRLLRNAVVVTVLFLMSLPLEARAMWQTLRRPAAPALGVVLNSVGIPLLAWAVVAVGHGMLGEGLSLGLLVAAATPCTLASAAVWTRRAGGNDAASIMVTVITNATCFLVTPAWLLLTTGKQSQLDAGRMITSLGLIVVLPMAAAQLLRVARPVGHWATRHKTPLGVIAQAGVLTMVFIGSVRTAQRFHAAGTAPAVTELAALVLAATGIHLLGLICGIWLARWFGLERRDQIAVGLAGSQKTQMVGLQICIELGFNIIPMVTYHVSQLLLDTLVVDRFRVATKDDPPAP